jgi:Tol biopolymer transport system component
MISSATDNIGDGAIDYSPDGKSIAFFSEGKIKTIPVEGGETRVLVNDVQSGRHSNLVWSPDGSKIAYNAQSENKIWITTLATGEKTVLKTGLPDNFWVSEFDWSPDGKKITFMTTSGNEPEFYLISNFMNF